MKSMSRRGFVQAAAGAVIASAGNFGGALAADPEPMRMGLLVSAASEPDKVMAQVRSFGIPTVHVSTSAFSPAMAKGLNIPFTFNQWGYIPEAPSDPLYEPTVKAVQEIAAHCKAKGQIFVNETGQETPVTLLRTILDTGMDNVKVV